MFGDDPTTGVLVLRLILIAAGVLAVGVLGFILGRMVWLAVRGARRGARVESAATTSVARHLADQARSDLLAFGEAIDAEEMNPHDDLVLWESALKKHEAASRLLADRPDDQGHRQVIELCRLGRVELTRAQRAE